MESTIKLFRALPVKNKKGKIDADLMAKTIKKGFIFAPEVVANYSNYDELIRMVEKHVGLSAEEMNSSFHKDWKKVRDASIEQLVIEQMVHYLSTYGKEAGLIDLPDDYVYIPTEKLNIPDIDVNVIKLTVIKGYTKSELKEKLLGLLQSGIALAEDTIKSAVEVAVFVGLDDFDSVKNKEVKVMLYDFSTDFNIIPSNPTEFIRFIIYKATGTTLLIKSKELLEKIRSGDNLNVVGIFQLYEKKYGLEKLAAVFNRFKPIFLAFRTNEILKTKINRVRKLAIKHHKPMPEDYLNTVTARLARGEDIGIMTLLNELNKVNVFRKIRLAYALKFRTNEDVDSILYRVRNGKGFAKEFSFAYKDRANMVLDCVLNSIATDMSANVKGLNIYIPENMCYALPATEKQFTGNFPSGTYISLPENMIAGIHWYNVDGNRIDLDLSIMSANEKYGWDGYYREGSNIMFSGDLTDARNGASELYFIKKQAKKVFIMFVNYFNFDEKIEVPFKILVAKRTGRFGRNYMVDPNDVFAVAKTVINKAQKMLGLMVTTPEENRFYFAETSVGNKITAGHTDYANQARKWLINYFENTIDLRDILRRAGAVLVEDKDDADLDLSPEILEKDSFLSILK